MKLCSLHSGCKANLFVSDNQIAKTQTALTSGVQLQAQVSEIRGSLQCFVAQKWHVHNGWHRLFPLLLKQNVVQSGFHLPVVTTWLICPKMLHHCNKIPYPYLIWETVHTLFKSWVWNIMVCCSENLKNLSKTEQNVDTHCIKFESYLVITAQVSVCVCVCVCVCTDLEKADLCTLIKIVLVV